jgi:predicted outer membrane protein
MRIIVAAALVALLCAAGRAQNAIGSDDFLRFVLSWTRMQAELSELVPERSVRDDVKTFARELASGTSALAESAEQVPGGDDVALPASGMDVEHRAIVEGLAPLSGEEFDRRFLQAEAHALQQAIALGGAVQSGPAAQLAGDLVTFSEQALAELPRLGP